MEHVFTFRCGCCRSVSVLVVSVGSSVVRQVYCGMCSQRVADVSHDGVYSLVNGAVEVPAVQLGPMGIVASMAMARHRERRSR